MSLNINKVKSTGGPKAEPLDAGGYPGRVVMIVDLGLQPQREFKGVTKEPAPEVNITYELSDEFLKDEEGNDQLDKPRWQSETFTLRNAKADKAISTLRYKVLDPEGKDGGDFAKQVGKPVIVNVVQKPGTGKNIGKTFTNVASITQVRAKDLDKIPPLVKPPVVFLLDDPDLEVFESLPQFLQDKITSNLEFNGSPLQKLLGKAPKAEEEAEEQEAEVATNESDW